MKMNLLNIDNIILNNFNYLIIFVKNVNYDIYIYTFNKNFLFFSFFSNIYANNLFIFMMFIFFFYFVFFYFIFFIL